jgi:thiamine pyrophosphate-dependent acetolactate synthase large subunit-like protein
MNLGCLVTIASHPANLYLIIVDNGHYEVTGGQPTAGSGLIDFPGLARAAGIGRVYSFEEAQSWKQGAEEALRDDGPVFICLKVEPVFGKQTPKPARPMAEQIGRLKQALK